MPVGTARAVEAMVQMGILVAQFQPRSFAWTTPVLVGTGHVDFTPKEQFQAGIEALL